MMWMKLFDWTHDISENLAAYTTEEKITLDIISRSPIFLTLFKGSLHNGTHVDAPLHMIEGGASIDTIPLERYFGIAKILTLNCRSLEKITPKMLRELNDLKDYGLIINTNWWKKINSRDFLSHHPSIMPETATLIAQSGVKYLGIDFPSIDPPDSSNYPAHKILMNNSIPIIESIKPYSVKKVGILKMYVAIIPMKFRGVEAAPARVIAWDLKDNSCPLKFNH